MEFVELLPLICCCCPCETELMHPPMFDVVPRELNIGAWIARFRSENRDTVRMNMNNLEMHQLTRLNHINDNYSVIFLHCRSLWICVNYICHCTCNV